MVEPKMSNSYISPFSTRYASKEMQEVFSNDRKFRTWRKLWIALAKAERELGLDITEEQIRELEAHAEDINYDVAEAREREVRHDVMAHVYAYGVQCPKAKGIIHLGATSCYVGDNTDVILMRDALRIVRRKLVNVIALLSEFAMKYRDMPALAYTHLQPAQLTTVGKRATLWAYEFLQDLEEIDHRLGTLKLLGCKGTTGTQASFVELFAGDEGKIRRMEELIAQEMGFPGRVVPVSGQTYSRKVDYFVLAALGGFAQSASKFSTDLRLLQNFKEMEEPFEKHQIGSSAMPYKRNPMRSERITSLARYVMVDTLNPAFTSATQWFERTLDDSANKRISVAEGFLAVDSILNILLNVCDGLVVYPKVVRQRVMKELPFMATENIMMKAVKKGGDRQQLHERLREHSMAAARNVKEEGLENDLIDRICADPAFGLDREELDALMSPELFTGRSASQVVEFVEGLVRPVLEENREILGERAQLSV
jgi:adenylosuccinate lyase